MPTALMEFCENVSVVASVADENIIRFRVVSVVLATLEPMATLFDPLVILAPVYEPNKALLAAARLVTKKPAL